MWFFLFLIFPPLFFSALGHWVLFHKKEHEKIVGVWYRVLCSAPVDQKLAFLFLLNDVSQTSRRRGVGEFVSSFSRVLADAFVHVHITAPSPEVRASVIKTLKVLEERSIFSPQLIADVRKSIAEAPPLPPPSSSSSVVTPPPPPLTMQSNPINVALSRVEYTESEIASANQKVTDSVRPEVFTGALLPSIRTKGDMTELAYEFEDDIKVLESLKLALTAGIEARQNLAGVLGDAVQANTLALSRGLQALENTSKTLAGVEPMKQRMKALYERLPETLIPSTVPPEPKKQKMAQPIQDQDAPSPPDETKASTPPDH